MRRFPNGKRFREDMTGVRFANGTLKKRRKLRRFVSAILTSKHSSVPLKCTNLRDPHLAAPQDARGAHLHPARDYHARRKLYARRASLGPSPRGPSPGVYP